MRFGDYCINLFRASIVNNIDKNKTYGIFASLEGRKIEARIEEAGGTVISFPVPEYEKIILAESDCQRLRKISEFDWIIFTGVLSARCFVEAFTNVAGSISDLDELRICSAGENVVHYLRNLQIHSDLIFTPELFDTGSVIAEFAGDELGGSKFLVPTNSSAQSLQFSDLKALGATIIEIPMFHLRSAAESDFARSKALLLGGAVDELIFSSEEDLFSLFHLFADQTPGELLNELGVLAADWIVFQSLVSFGLHPRYLYDLPL